MREQLRKLIPILIVATIGLVVSMYTESVHRSLQADAGYRPPFCSINERIDCEGTLGSEQANFAGVSVSVWAMLFYAGVLASAAGIAMSRSALLRARLATGILVAAAWGLAFSLNMARIAFLDLHTVCLMCSTLYLVAIAMFVTAWQARRAFAVVGGRKTTIRVGQDRVVLGGAAFVLVALLAVIGWEVFGPQPGLATVEEIRGQRPDFYKWFTTQPVAQVPTDGSNARGDADAPVTIVEFSDFGCGHCNAFHQSVDELFRRERHGVRVVFHHFPLDSACNAKMPSRLHPQSCLAAIAAECAAEQGKFWAYHNLLFDHQQQQEREFLLQYADKLKLDKERFTACLASDAARLRVERDAQLGGQLGIDSTPTVFINGRIIKGALNAEALADALVLARADSATVRH